MLRTDTQPAASCEIRSREYCGNVVYAIHHCHAIEARIN